jgi:GntR family transcriptional regulator, transcriptional repressor for pyruvate dehydrogenase complex
MKAMDFKENMFRPIRGKRTFEEVSDKVKNLIFKGVLKVGDRLPSEAALARQFNVGRQSLREALRLLELSGFIEIQKGSTGGPVVRNMVLNNLSKSFLDAIQIKGITIDQLTAARLDVEMAVMRHVLNNIDESDFNELNDNVEQAAKKIESGSQAFRENIQFHKLLARASKNPVFTIVVEAIMAVCSDFLSRREPEINKSRHVVETHREILHAMARQDRERAMHLLEKHLLEVRKWL